MKKIFVSLFCFLLFSFIFAETLPSKLLGIWESKDRYVFFEQNDQEDPQLVVILKTYYGWYLNRAAEPEDYSKKEARVRNTANACNAEHIYIKNLQLTETANSLYGSLDLAYSGWQKNTIPFLLIDGSIYLSYFEKDIPAEIDENKSWNFYRGIAPSKGFI